MRKQNEFEEIIDRAAGQIRSSRLSKDETDAIGARVWSRLEATDPTTGDELDESLPIRSCEDY